MIWREYMEGYGGYNNDEEYISCYIANALQM
jgi:hypothetical protein